MKGQAKDITKRAEGFQINDASLRGLVGYHLKRASNVVQADLARTLKPFELRMLTFTVLVLIVENPGMRQSQLADALKIERPNLVLIIDELENRDLIVREKVPTDRRAYALNATLSGRRLYKKSLAAVKRHEADLLAGMTPKELQALIDTLQTIQRLGASQ